jgi:glycerol uptake facilitator-like aquaporin
MEQFLGCSDVRRMSVWRAAFAEFIGTLLLTFIGCGTCLGKDHWETAPFPTTVQVGERGTSAYLYWLINVVLLCELLMCSGFR